MASLLKDHLFEIGGTAPSPSKDFYYLIVTKSDVIWRWWKISLRLVYRYSRPGEIKMSQGDFITDYSLHTDVRRVFGQKVLDYALALCRGEYDYLVRMPEQLLLQIIGYLQLDDVYRLGQTCNKFRKLCHSEEFMERMMEQRLTAVSVQVSDQVAPKLSEELLQQQAALLAVPEPPKNENIQETRPAPEARPTRERSGRGSIRRRTQKRGDLSG